MTDGLKVAVLGTDPQTRNRYIVLAVAEALRRHPGVARVSLPTYADVARHCADEPVDLLLAIGGGAIVEPLQRAIQHSGRAALWVTEDPYELPRNIELARLFDIVFSNDSNARRQYPADALHLPLAASPLFHDYPVVSEPKDFLFDLFFVGTAWPDRVDTLNQLLAILPRSLRKKIGLSGNQFLPDFHLGDLDLITDFRLAPREFARMANRSVVALTLDRGFSAGPAPDIEGSTPPPRVFEHALAGAAQVYLTGRPDIAAYFKPDEEILVAQTIADAAAAIQRLVEDPQARRRMAQAARERALVEHLYEQRVDRLMAAVARTSPRLRPAYPAAQRKRVLLVSHNVVGGLPFGGVELYQQTLADVLSHHDFAVLYPDHHTGKLTLRRLATGETESFAAGPIDHTVISNRVRERTFVDLLFRDRIDLVHYHHLLGHPLGLPLLSHAAGVPGVFHVHDYFGICPEYNLIDPHGRYCGVRDERTEICDACLGVRDLARPGAQARRRWVMSQALDRMDAIVHSTEYTRRKFTEIYPDLPADRHHVIGNSARADTLRQLGQVREPGSVSTVKAPGRLQVAVLGNFSGPKGAELLIGIFQRLAHAPLDIHILGRADDKFASLLGRPEFRNVTVHGAYDLPQLPKKLRAMDVSLHFSIWPETYCIGLDEARAAGLVPVVLGYGALAERVRHGIDGFVVDPDHPFDLIGILHRLAGDRSVLARMRYELDRLLRAHDEHFAALDKIYHNLFAGYPAHPVSVSAPQGRPLLFDDLQIRFNNDNCADLAVVYDDNPLRENPIAATVEQRARAEPPELLPGAGSPAVEAEIGANDEGISILVDEVTDLIFRQKVVFLPYAKRTLVLGVGVPARRRLRPIEITLVGPRRYRLALSDGTIRGSEMTWSTSHIDLASIEDGAYAIVVALQSGLRTLTYASGTRVALGRGAALPLPEGGPRSQPSTDRAARPRGQWPTLWQSSRMAAIASKRLIRTSLDIVASGSRHAVRSRFRFARQNIMAHVDSINGSRPSPGHPTRVPRARGMAVRGWAVPRDRASSFDAITVCLTGRSDARSPSMPPLERPDVAAHFSSNALLRSGIESSIDVRDLEPGSYELEIIGLDADGRSHIATAGMIEIE